MSLIRIHKSQVQICGFGSRSPNWHGFPTLFIVWKSWSTFFVNITAYKSLELSETPHLLMNGQQQLGWNQAMFIKKTGWKNWSTILSWLFNCLQKFSAFRNTTATIFNYDLSGNERYDDNLGGYHVWNNPLAHLPDMNMIGAAMKVEAVMVAAIMSGITPWPTYQIWTWWEQQWRLRRWWWRQSCLE